MPEVTVSIGKRNFVLACNEGEEPHLKAAAKLLSAEADTLQSQIGRVPEARMLLMSGLMLADKVKEMEAAVGGAVTRIEELEAQITATEARMTSMAVAAPKAFPNEEVLLRSYEDAVLRLEELADEIEGK
ncbi:MAG: cell division protein ZapA [Paracoccaceae bacterium]|jgi:cell division protein ZapA